jgi:hypothetical protein
MPLPRPPGSVADRRTSGVVGLRSRIQESSLLRLVLRSVISPSSLNAASFLGWSAKSGGGTGHEAVCVAASAT